MTVPLPSAGDTSWHDWGQYVQERVTAGIDGKIDAEQARDVIGSALRAGANVTITTDDAANTITIAAAGGTSGTTDPEVVRDTMAAALRAGTNVTIAVDDAANTITISASGGSGTPADATATSKGVVQLAGDLGGTATAPTVTATPANTPNAISRRDADGQITYSRVYGAYSPPVAASELTRKDYVDAGLDAKISSSSIDNDIVLTQAAYDALATKDSRTRYNIVG